ncbi:potassium channel family protein [Vibrio coralliirubri]|uniref:potassium channel family protein n=1 Tax=Vibrio coralliirubri TaxID=1516159 RepID=UPI0012FFB542|nr:potassium channel family protein [Vibrio coralliirubri]
MDKNWFEETLETLKVELKTNSYIDGSSFLFNSLQENWPDELEYDVDDDVLEDYVSDNIDLFERWMSNNEPSIKISNGYIWSFNLDRNIKDLDDNLGKNEELLIPVEGAEISDILELVKVRERFVKQGEYSKAYSYAKKILELTEKNKPSNDNALSKALESLGDIVCHLPSNRMEQASYYEKAAINKLSNNDTLSSAKLYKKAKNSEGISLSKKLELIRKSRVLFSESGVNDEASNLYIEECDINRGQKVGLEKLKLSFYKALSNYGESPWLVLFWIAIVILLWALFYSLFDINVPSDGVLNCDLSVVDDMRCFEIENKQEPHPLTYIYFSFVTFTTLGYGDYSPVEGAARFFASAQALIGLILSSLFIATFIRKFSR